MKTQHICDNCPVMSGYSFFIECSDEEVENIIVPLIGEYNRKSNKGKSHFYGEDEYDNYFLVSVDGKKIIPTRIGYIYSSLWNAYSPFLFLPEKITFNDLSELEEIFDKSMSEKKLIPFGIGSKIGDEIY